MAWLKGIAQWREHGYLCLSVPFTWLLPEALGICLQNPRERIAVGGPAVRIMPDYLRRYAEVEPFVPEQWPLQRHNPEATRTSAGCPNACEFCSVRVVDGPFRELDEWPAGRIICDNNLLACSDEHLERVAARLRGTEGLDLQGIDPALVTPERAAWIVALRPVGVRMGWDTEAEEPTVWRAIDRLRTAGLAKKPLQVYCLVNYGETQAQAMYRLQALKAAGIRGYAMRYQTTALRRNDHVDAQWTDPALKRFCRYWNRQSVLAGIPWEQYITTPYQPQERLPL